MTDSYVSYDSIARKANWSERDLKHSRSLFCHVLDLHWMCRGDLCPNSYWRPIQERESCCCGLNRRNLGFVHWIYIGSIARVKCQDIRNCALKKIIKKKNVYTCLQSFRAGGRGRRNWELGWFVSFVQWQRLGNPWTAPAFSPYLWNSKNSMTPVAGF